MVGGGSGGRPLAKLLTSLLVGERWEEEEEEESGLASSSNS